MRTANASNQSAPGTIDRAARRRTRPTFSKHALLPFQAAWCADESPLKIYEKSRRIGITRAEAWDATSRRFNLANPLARDFWFSSADESAAQEFIEYCADFARLFRASVKILTEVEVDEYGHKDTKLVIKAPHAKIVAMSSNPKRFRSKGGDACLDEFAFHDSPREMFAAVTPLRRWGGSIRVISTHNGEASQFQRMIRGCQQILTELGQPISPPPRIAYKRLMAAGERLKVSPVLSYHRTTVEDALGAGLLERINLVSGQSLTRDEFLAECRAECLDADHFGQEYMCQPSTDSNAWLTYEQIAACEDDIVGLDRRDNYAGGECVAGVDVGRSRDLTVLWICERVGDVWHTRLIQPLAKMALPDQQTVISSALRSVRLSRCAIDKTGIGLGLFEYLQRELGGVIEGYQFTEPSKHPLAVAIQRAFSDRAVRIPSDRVVREDLHKVRKVVTPGGGLRFVAERDKDGHADYFWALALAMYATARDARPWGALC